MKSNILIKKWIALIVGISMIFVIVPVAGAAATFTDATPIEIGKPYTDNLEKSTDINMYKVELPSNGKFYTTFSHDQISSGGWKTTIYDSANKELTNFTISYSTMTKDSYAVRVPAGTCYIKVSSNGFNNADYKITANFSAEGDSFEKESNNTMQTANPINPGKEYTGNLSISSDIDYYKLDLSSDAKMNVTFSHDQITSGGWRTIVYDSANKELTNFSISSSTMTKDSNSLRLTAGTYYIKVSSTSFSNADYTIKASITVEDNNYEKEPNNTMQTANQINAGQEYTGNLSVGSDIDYYKFNISSGVSAKIRFSHDQVSSGGWRTIVYDSANKELTNFSIGSSTMTKDSNSLPLTAGTYYIKVSSTSFSNADYKIQVVSEEETYTPTPTPTPTPMPTPTPTLPSTGDIYQDSFNRLNSLKVVWGYPDGSIGADYSITRAEFAVIVVKLKDIDENVISAANGATRFNDVPANHWASGVINLAVNSGIIGGYPDNTFKPDRNVTAAEMCAMLIRMLGYGNDLEGTWPNNVVNKAYELGLLNGVNIYDSNGYITRGQMFLASCNALNVKPLLPGGDGYKEDTMTLGERLAK